MERQIDTNKKDPPEQGMDKPGVCLRIEKITDAYELLQGGANRNKGSPIGYIVALFFSKREILQIWTY